MCPSRIIEFPRHDKLCKCRLFSGFCRRTFIFPPPIRFIATVSLRISTGGIISAVTLQRVRCGSREGENFIRPVLQREPVLETYAYTSCVLRQRLIETLVAARSQSSSSIRAFPLFFRDRCVSSLEPGTGRRVIDSREKTVQILSFEA